MLLSLVLLAVSLGVADGNPYLRNIAYQSPFESQPDLGYDLDSIHRRRNFRRQMVDASPFKDQHYVLYSGGDFSNAPFIWSGGVNFTHSVASGDPLSTSILLWTRAAPATDGVPDQSVPICVSFSIWDNAGQTGSPVDTGDAFTSLDVDWTLKVEASGLKPDTWYWYQFADCTNPETTSPLGRTRTFADPETPANEVNGGNPLKLAVFSCSNFPFGFFNAYRVARENVSADAFVHLHQEIVASHNGALVAPARPALKFYAPLSSARVGRASAVRTACVHSSAAHERSHLGSMKHGGLALLCS